MNETRSAHERLDALLIGLEDEVMRGEGGVTIDPKAMRVEIEALIDKHMGVAGAEHAAMRKAVNVKGKVVSVVGLLGRWGRIGQGGVRSSLGPRVRMAFSGSKSGQDEERGGSDSGDQAGKKED